MTTINTVNTVNGPVSADKLGKVLMHEHIIATSITMSHYFGNTWLSESTVVERAVQRLSLARQTGLNTIVDCTPLNLGRNVRLLQKVSKLTGIHILASTGMFHVTDFAFMRIPPKVLARHFATECDNGMEDTDVKPAIIKCAVENAAISHTDTSYLQFTAELHALTGLPVTMHTQAKFSNGIPAAKFLIDCGVPPQHLVVGHVLDSLDINYPLQLLDLGVHVCCDRLFSTTDDFRDKVAVIAQLVKRGFASKIMLSHDHICCENKWNSLQEDSERPQSVHDNPRALTVIPECVVPELLANGVRNDDINAMLAQNPQAFLAQR